MNSVSLNFIKLAQLYVQNIQQLF